MEAVCRTNAVRVAHEAQENVQRLERELEALDKTLHVAFNDVIAAQNDADRASANAKLDQIRKQKVELEMLARASPGDPVRRSSRGVTICNECTGSPFSPGCGCTTARSW